MNSCKPNYPRNCWWIAARSEELGRKPLARQLLDEPVVMFRKEDGEAVALEDRCVHRWLPLSAGRLMGDTLVCGYHGFRYDCAGRCVKIPSQESIPRAARVRSYPVVECPPFVWIWMGDPARSGDVAIPRLEHLDDSGWVHIADYLHLKSNYFLLQENVLDLTHFAFVHATTLEFEGWDTQQQDEVSVEGQTVRFRRHLNKGPLAPFLTIPAGLPEAAVADTTTFGAMLLPGVHTAGIDIGDPYLGGNHGRDFRFRISHLTTPETSGTTHYWWVIGQNYGSAGSLESASVHDIITAAFKQDQDVLENIQHLVARDPRGSNAPEISVASDRSGIQARRVLQVMLDSD